MNIPCGCNGGYPPVSKRCKCKGGVGPDKKGVVKFCDLCDPCNENVSTVKLCAFVVPTLEDGRYYKNSFVFTQDEDATYYISDDRSEIPFGTRPKFIDNFSPIGYGVKNSVVIDIKNNKLYAFNSEGDYIVFDKAEGDNVKVLTTEDYNWPANAPEGVALWGLEPGYYVTSGAVHIWTNDHTLITGGGAVAISNLDNGAYITYLSGSYPRTYYTNISDGEELGVSEIVDNLTSTSGTSPLAARQGTVLNEKIGDLSELDTTDKTSIVNAINELADRINNIGG